MSTTWKSWYEQLCHMVVFGTDSKAQIARELGKSRNTVYRALNENGAVKERIRELAEQKQLALTRFGAEQVQKVIKDSWETMADIVAPRETDELNYPVDQRRQAATTILKGTGQLVEKREEEIKGIHGVIILPAQVPVDKWREYLEKQAKEIEPDDRNGEGNSVGVDQARGGDPGTGKG